MINDKNKPQTPEQDTPVRTAIFEILDQYSEIGKTSMPESMLRSIIKRAVEAANKSITSRAEKAERERDALKIEYESRVVWLEKMYKIIGYDNSDGFHCTPGPHEIAEKLVSDLAACVQLREAVDKVYNSSWPCTLEGREAFRTLGNILSETTSLTSYRVVDENRLTGLVSDTKRLNELWAETTVDFLSCKSKLDTVTRERDSARKEIERLRAAHFEEIDDTSRIALKTKDQYERAIASLKFQLDVTRKELDVARKDSARLDEIEDRAPFTYTGIVHDIRMAMDRHIKVNARG